MRPILMLAAFAASTSAFAQDAPAPDDVPPPTDEPTSDVPASAEAPAPVLDLTPGGGGLDLTPAGEKTGPDPDSVAAGLDLTPAAPAAPTASPTATPTVPGAAPAWGSDEAERPVPRFTIGGMVQYDLRFRPIQYEYGTYYDDIEDPPTLERNELLGKVNATAKYGKFGAVADVDLVLRAYPRSDTLNALSSYNANTPFRVEAHDLYMYARDLFKGFDLRIGQQKAMFGVGDQFNPTNTVNANDYEDVLLFGDQQGNLMVRMDYTPRWNVSLTGILVPVFKPALLPRTAYLGQDTSRYPYVDAQTRWNFATEQGLGAGQFSGAPVPEVFPTVVGDVAVLQPEFSAENMQGFFRVGGLFGPIDVALSYYRGFSDIPQAVRTDTYQIREQQCEFAEDVGRPAEERRGQCVDGVLENDVALAFPRMHVLGLNLAGEAKIGYRFEFAMVFPEKVRNPVTQHDVSFSAGPLGTIEVDGAYPFRNADADLVVDGRPFAKWVLGLDYTFGKHVMLNMMWIHGFPDEFGAGDWIQEGYTVRNSGLIDNPRFGDCVQLGFDEGNVTRAIDGRQCARETLRPRLGDYVVLGLDFNFAAQRGLFRLFTIWDMTGIYFDQWDAEAGERVRTYRHAFTNDGFSAVIYPDFRWNFGKGFELHAGALVQLGKPYTKFGAPENGGHLIWTRARYSF